MKQPGPALACAHEAVAILDRLIRNQSIYDISLALKREGIERTPVAVAAILRQEGFAKLPRRGDDERPAGTKPALADRADVRALNLEPRTFRTQFGGLFLFLPALVEMGFDRVIQRCNLPGTQMVPAAHAFRSLLALKLYGTQRHLHVMSAVLDEGLALFAGLNIIPKRSFLTEYSCRLDPSCYPRLMRHWFDAITGLGLKHGTSFDLDFHTIPGYRWHADSIHRECRLEESPFLHSRQLASNTPKSTVFPNLRTPPELSLCLLGVGSKMQSVRGHSPPRLPGRFGTNSMPASYSLPDDSAISPEAKSLASLN